MGSTGRAGAGRRPALGAGDLAERRHIRRILDQCGGDKREAARRLGMGLSSLYRKLEDEGV